MNLKSITENKLFLFGAHLIFPPFATWLLTKNSPDILKDQFEGKIYSSTVWGVSLGFVLGLLIVAVLLAINIWLPGLMSIGIPILIGIPWVTSVIGKGLGVIHGLFKTLNGPKFILPIIWSALKVAFTGDTFTRIWGFYSCFYKLNDDNETINFSLLNDIRAQSIVLMIENDLLDPEMLEESSVPDFRFRFVLEKVILKILKQSNTPLRVKTHFLLEESDDLSSTITRTLDEEIESLPAHIHNSFFVMQDYGQSSKIVMLYLRNYVSEVKRQIDLLQLNHIDPQQYLEKITAIPGRTGKWITELLRLQKECATNEHFEEYNTIFSSRLRRFNTLDDEVVNHFFASCMNLEKAFKNGELDASERELVLSANGSNVYLYFESDNASIETHLKSVLKLRAQGRLSNQTARKEIYNKPAYINYYASLDTAPDLEEKKSPPNDQLEQKSELEPLQEIESVHSTAPDKEMVFLSYYLDTDYDMQTLIENINTLNRIPEGRQVWNDYFERWQKEESKTHIFIHIPWLSSLALLYQTGQGQYVNKLLTKIGEISWYDSGVYIHACVLSLFARKDILSNDALDEEFNAIWTQHKLQQPAPGEGAFLSGTLKKMHELNLFSTEIPERIRRNRMTYAFKHTALVTAIVRPLNHLLTRKSITPQTFQWAFDRMFLALHDGRHILGLLTTLLPLEQETCTLVNDQNLKALLINTLYIDRLALFFTEWKDLFKSLSPTVRTDLVTKIIAKGSHVDLITVRLEKEKHYWWIQAYPERLEELLQLDLETLRNELIEKRVEGIKDREIEFPKIEIPIQYKTPDYSVSEAKQAVDTLRVDALLCKKIPSRKPQNYTLGLFTTPIGDIQVFNMIESYLTKPVPDPASALSTQPDEEEDLSEDSVIWIHPPN